MAHTAQSASLAGRIPAELRLMLDCLRAAEEADPESAVAFPVDGIDWNSFVGLCRHHRVVPLVYRAMSSGFVAIPAQTLRILKEDAAENAMSALRYLAETHRICTMLQEAAIPARVLKGVPLSQAIYGDPALRDVGDIDLLIPPGREGAADDLLIAAGFHRGEPAARLTPRRRRAWEQHGKDYTYRNDRIGFEVDLHWRLFRNPHMPGNALAGDPQQGIDLRLGEMTFSVLPLDRTILYLCVHGALDGWFRFKSLVDIVSLWNGFSSDQRTRITELAREFRVLAELTAALRLAQELGLLHADALNAQMQLQTESREVRWILDYARTQHEAQHFQPTSTSVGSWTLKRYELGLRPGLAYKSSIIRRILFRPRVWERVDLPDFLFPLYALLSPLEWMFFHRPAARESSSAVEPSRRHRGRWKRWRSLPAADRLLLIESFVALTTARCALALLPARWIFRWLARPLRRRPAPSTSGAPERIRWAVLSVARYGPLSFVCFPQALAAHALLRRRGIRSVMHYGVRRSADRQMRAHTWLEVDQRMLLGGESATLFAPIHSTGSTDPS